MYCAEPPTKKKKELTMGEASGDNVRESLTSPMQDETKCSPDIFIDSSQETVPEGAMVLEDSSLVGRCNLNIPMEESFSGSPDLFADSSPDLMSDFSQQDKDEEEKHSDLTHNNCQGNENENVEDCPWRGVSLSELASISNFPQMPPIKPCSTHTVLFQVGAAVSLAQYDAWDNDHVRMPYSPQSLYPVSLKGDKLRSRWEMVKEALNKSISSSMQLEAAILSYNSKYSKRWDFSGLHYFFSEVLEPPEVRCFFNSLLPDVIKLALQLPTLVTRPIPLLRQHMNHSISLNQLQIASLLANALLCTFPRRNTAKQTSEYAMFPDINFNRLFLLHRNKSLERGSEKLKCLFHYFRRVCHKGGPEGTVTFTRRYIPPKLMPQWERSVRPLRKLHISCEGTIEDQGFGMLQMDFANKKIGGGVLGWGCVQEEIRFVICPELIISRLFTESLDVTESLQMTGCERFSNYEGYADSFEWQGDNVDKTPRDTSGRLLCSIVAIDAMALRFPSVQFLPQNMLRELNKAYVGFHNTDIPPEHLSAVATGNWGCGAYRGNARLKAVLQLMAAAQTGRHLAYFTFGDKALRDDVYHMHTFLLDHQVTVGRLWNLLSRYYDQSFRNGKITVDLYPFLYQMIDSTSPVSSPIKDLNMTNKITGPIYCGPLKKASQRKEETNRNEEKSKKKLMKTPPPKYRDSPTTLNPQISSPAGNLQGARSKLSNFGGGNSNEQKQVKVDNNKSLEASSESEQASSNANSRSNLVDWLETYDRQASTTSSSPVSRRKISDYFHKINL